METVRAGNVINAKRAKKKLSPVDHACPFCRSAPKASKSQYENRSRTGDAKATCNLAIKYRDGDARMNISQDHAKSLELFHHAADDLGSALAMFTLGRAYSYGLDGAPKDRVKGLKYSDDAVKMGNVSARFILGGIEAENRNFKLAIRHWKLAAAAGDIFSVKMLWECFYEGTLEKAELEKTLRAHKEACDAMNSEERERHALLKKAEADGDEMRTGILRSYYDGDIKAKELNLALKALRKADGYM
jgi:TPR repeat protein